MNPLLRPLEELALECQKAIHDDAILRVAQGLGPEPFISLHIERVLRAKLMPLLEAGQAMRVRMGAIPTFSEDRDAIQKWDAALAKVKGKSA